MTARVLLGARPEARRAAGCLGELALCNEIELALGAASVRKDVADRVEEPTVSLVDVTLREVELCRVQHRVRQRDGRGPAIGRELDVVSTDSPQVDARVD